MSETIEIRGVPAVLAASAGARGPAGLTSAHEFAVRRILMRLELAMADRPDLSGLIAAPGVEVVGPDDAPRHRADLAIVATDAAPAAGGEVPAGMVAAVIEVAGPRTPAADLEALRRDFPRMGVPVYVVIDPRDGVVVAHHEPRAGRYTARDARVYGVPATVPGVDIVLATDDLPRY